MAHTYVDLNTGGHCGRRLLSPEATSLPETQHACWAHAQGKPLGKIGLEEGMRCYQYASVKAIHQ